MDLGYSGLTPRSSCRGRDPRHQSDVARLAVLEELGGLYVDLDLIVVRPLDPLMGHDVVLGAESPTMLGSGFILAARANATFIRR